MQTPTTLDPGDVQVGLQLGVQSRSAGEPSSALVPDVSLRVGVVKDLDMGVRLRPVAAEGGFKYQLARGEPDIAVTGSYLFSQDEDSVFDEDWSPSDRTEVQAGRAALYIGTDPRQDMSLWLAPTFDAGVREVYVFDSTQIEPLVATGCLLGFVVGPEHSPLRMLIEVGVLVPVAGPSHVIDNSEHRYETRLGPSDVRFEGGISVLMGN